MLSVVHGMEIGLPRNNSASLLYASIRSLLLPSFNRAFLRGSQTTKMVDTRLQWQVMRNQAAEVPSSKGHRKGPLAILG